MTAGGMAAAHLALVPHFERTTGHTVVTDATSTGIGRDSIASRVRRGEPVDVLILARAALDELIGEGKVIADYVGPLPAEVQRVTIFSAGVAVGAKSPDAARALIEFFASRSGTETMTKSGLDPISRH
jgi:ABC-type molybdate transport system substrate-binding protein